MVTDNELAELVSQVARLALGAKRRIVTAESCTGGWIAKVFTDVAGSSQWFDCGYVTYSDAAKIRDLGVAARTIKEHGAVSEPTVREMAAGALRVTGAGISIAVSGIAGPDGGSAEKPVGTVWFCVGKRVGGAGAPAAGHGAGAPTVGALGAPDGPMVGAVPGMGAGVAMSAGGAVDEIGGDSTPPGGSPKPAGDSHIELLTDGQLFGGNREAVRRLSVQHALKLVLRLGA